MPGPGPMFKKCSIALLSLTVLLVASCGDDGSPTDPGTPDPQPTASTPEQFLALLDSAVSTRDFPLYRALFDSSYVFEPGMYFEWPGDTATSWNYVEEMDLMERLLSGSPSYQGFVLFDVSFPTHPETVFVDTVSREGPDTHVEYRIRFRITGVATLEDENPYDLRALGISSRQEITLRPSLSRPEHLVAVLETEGDPWDVGSRSPPRYSWGYLKSMFRDGAETPEEFLGRFVESFPRDRNLLHSSFEFLSCAGDTARGIAPIFTCEEVLDALRQIRYHRDNPNGWRTTSARLSLDPKSIVENEDHHVDKAANETWWDVRTGTRLDVTFLGPDGEEQEVTIAAEQLWVLRSNRNDGGLRLYRQYDSGTSPGAGPMTWGYLFAMFLPEDPEAVVGRLVHAYAAGDPEGYTACLDDSFHFEMKPANPNDPAPGWGRAEEVRIADRVFGGWTNANDQAVTTVSLFASVLRVDPVYGGYPDRNHREAWYEVTTGATVSFLVDEGDGLSPVGYGNTADHRFIVRPDGRVPVRYKVYRHLDPEPLDYGPTWEKGGTGDFDYLELDADGVLGDGPEHRQYALGDTVAVDCWMMGAATVRAWGVTVCPLTPALRFLDATYNLPEDWSGSPPSPYIGCTTLAGSRHSDGVPLTLPHRAGTYRYLVVEDDVYTGLEVDPSNSAWLDENGSTSGSFLGAGGLKVRVGRPITKPSSWGSTKALFR